MSTNGFEHGDVISVKLVSGEEIIGRMTDETDDFVFIDKPMTLVPNPQGLGMTQSLFSMDMGQAKAVGFRKTAIIAQAMTKHDLATHYLTNTSSIQIVPKGVLLG
jgi:hypothetical protein